MRWGRRLGLTGARAPKAAPEELVAAHDLRRAIHATFAAIAHGDAPPRRALELLAGTQAAAAAAGHLAGDGSAWTLT